MALNRVSRCLRNGALCRFKYSAPPLPADTFGIKPLTKCPRKFSPLTLLPDYSFLDGRPRPQSQSQRFKAEVQHKLCEKVADLSHELDVGLELYYKHQEEKEKTKAQILQQKLKPKGAALLNKN